MTTIDEQSTMGNDRPITNNSGDKFKRSNFAKLLSAQILALPTNESFVLGLSGPWGSGKTSILNMVENELSSKDEVVIIWFNPWLFSGTNELVEQFFSEIAAQIVENQPTNENGKQIAGTISTWLRRLQGVAQTAGTAIAQAKGAPAPSAAAVGAATSMALGAAADKLQSIQQAIHTPALQGSLRKQRKQLEELLIAFGKRIVVFIDDIDRLNPNEVREIVRLVRLTADFPNVYYLLAFDRFRVERALGDDAESGRAYLEKIFQNIFDLPPISQQQLQSFLANEVNLVIENKEHGPEHSEYLQDVFRQGIFPLFYQPRDVRRYINSLNFSLDAFGKELAVADILGLEAIRTLLPETFSLMQANADLLAVSEWSVTSRHQDEDNKLLWKRIIESAGDRQKPIAKLINLMFPYTNRHSRNITYDSSDWLKTWRRQRRVACMEHFTHYLSKILPEGALRPSHVESIVENLNNLPSFQEELQRLSAEEFSHVLMRLEDYQDKFETTQAELVLPVLINTSVGYLRDDISSPDSVFGPSFRLKCIIVRWLRKVEASKRHSVFLAIFDKIDALSWKAILWDIAKNWHEDDLSKRPLVGAEVAEEILIKLLDEIVSSLNKDHQKILSERRIFDLLALAARRRPEALLTLKELAKRDEFLIGVIKAALRVGYAQTVGSSVRRSIYELPWSLLKSMFGNDYLCERVKDLASRSTADAEAKQALTTALEYAEGKKREDSNGSEVDDSSKEDESTYDIEIEAANVSDGNEKA